MPADPIPGSSTPSAALLVLLSATSALSPFAMVVMAPALDALGRQFEVDAAQTQFLVSAYLLGLALAQPAAGILCDRLGRRPVVLAGFALFVLASIVCAYVARLDVLILMRFVQATGASVGTVASRATVRDMHDAAGSARALAYIAAAMGLSPIVGPLIGGFVSGAYGPQAVFLASAVIGAITWCWALIRYPETADLTALTQPTLSRWTASYLELLRSRIFLGYSMIYGLAQAVFFAFMAVGAAVFERHLGLGPADFGATWGAIAAAYVAGATLAGRLTVKMGLRRLLGAGLLVLLLGTWLLLLLVVAAGVTFWTLAVPLILLSAANGIVTPLALAGAVSCRPLIAGSSSGLSSAIGLTLSGLFTILAGAVYTDSFTPIAVTMATAATLTVASGWLTRPAAAVAAR